MNNALNDLKSELLDIKLPTACCRKAFLAGVIRGAGTLILENNHLSLKLEDPFLPLIERCIEHINSLIKFQPTVYKSVKKRSVSNKTYYGFVLEPNEAEKILKAINISSPLSLVEGIDVDALKKPCCRASFFRGLFLSSGTMTIAEEESAAQSKTKGYSLEMLLSNETVAEQAATLLTEAGVEPKIRMRKSVCAVYYKGADKLGDFLAYLGAMKTFFTLQDILVTRSVSNDVNRKMNCDSANLDRAMDAANRQNDAVKLIADRVGINALPEQLRVVAIARLNFPLAPMSELGAQIPNAPGKSGLYHRMNKLMQIANEIEKGEKNNDKRSEDNKG